MIRLFNVSVPTSLLLLMFCDAGLIALCFLVAGSFLLNPLLDPWFYLVYENGWLQLATTVITIQLGMYLVDLYDLLPVHRTQLIQKLCIVLGLTFLMQALLGYLKAQYLQLPQWTMMVGSIFVLLVIPIWRMIFFRLLHRVLPGTKLLFLGVSPVMTELVDTLLSRPELGFRVQGYLSHQPEDVPKAHYLGTTEELPAIVQQHFPDRVIVSPQADLFTQMLLDLRMSGQHLEDAARLYEEVFGRVSIKTLDTHQLLFSKDLKPQPWIIRLQMLYSLLGGLVGFILASPIMLVVAVLVKVTSKGPIFYSQQRVGKNGKTFWLYKFRSMYTDAEARTGPVWATKNDPRVTPLGRWLRHLRLDELPQFLNVVRGEMTLVGPRPERPEFCKVLEQKIPFYHQRHAVKPGITGWAQINHKYAETVEDTVTKLEYDLYYVKNLAPALDAYIIFHTLKVMLLFRGAQ